MATQQMIQSLSVTDDDSTHLFHSSPYPLYYVQSPSTTSNSAASTVVVAIPPPSSSTSPLHHHHHDSTRSRLTLSLSSSSRGSNNDSFVQEKKNEMVELKRGSNTNGVEDEEEIGGGEMRRRRRGLMEKLVIFDSNEPFCYVIFQFVWRIIVSLVLTLLVFYLATNPPEPEFSFKIVSIKQFNVGEGLDDTGVPTKLLSFNCSLDMEVVNRSKFFGLHISPLLEMNFGNLKFASSQSGASYVESTISSTRRLFIGVKNKPVYGAGTIMEDLLQSERGLSLIVRIRVQWTYRIVCDLIKTKHRHLENCIIILQAMQSPYLYTKMHNNNCFHD